MKKMNEFKNRFMFYLAFMIYIMKHIFIIKILQIEKIVNLYVSFFVVVIYMFKSQNLHLYIFWVGSL